MNNKIIVFYSYTGHTKMIAEIIKRKLNCDIIELQPKVAYSNNYQTVVDDEQNSEVSNYLPEIKEINIDFSKYDKIILGFPTWWYRPAPVIRTFMKKYDLSNKIIAPFATNAGWLGRSFKELETLCPNAKILNPMNIVFSQDYTTNQLKTSDEEIQNWLDKI